MLLSWGPPLRTTVLTVFIQFELVVAGMFLYISILKDLISSFTRGDRDLGVAFQTHPGRQAFISSGSTEPRSALESRRVSLGAHWVDSRESSLLRRLERGREIGR